MKKHILPIMSLVFLIVVIGTLLYQYFEKGRVTTDGWLTLLLMISLIMIQTPYWKEFFSKSDEDVQEEYFKKDEDNFVIEDEIHIELHTNFYKNGQKKFEGSYKDGEKDGLHIGWYENGQKKFERSFTYGKEGGLHIGWYENGQKKFQHLMKKIDYGFSTEERSEETTYWEEDGQKTFESLKDRTTEWYKNGQKMYEKIWEERGETNPKLIYLKEWDEDGSRKENKGWNEDGSRNENNDDKN